MIDKFFKEEEMSSDGAIMWIQALPSSAFTKHGVRRERLQLQAAAPLISRPLSPRSQTCKHILLHYACKSESSTEALFKSIMTKEKTQWGFEVDKNPLVDHPLADFLLLPSASLERVASQPRMIEKVNEKVVEDGSMLLIHFNGLCIVVLIACYVRLTHLMRVGTDIHRLGALIAVTVLAATPLLALEISQARAMRKVGLFRTWASDLWNQLDVICVLWVPATLLLGFARGADDATFDNFTAIGGLLLMMKLLGFLKVLNMKLATFVLALGIILSDIKSFLIVLVTIFVAFGYAFFVLISKDKVDLHDDDPDNVRCAAAFVILCNASAPSHALSFRPRASPSGAGMRLFSRCSTWVCSETSIATCSPATLSSCSSSCT